MSQTKNQERLEIVNKRLAEINEKDVFPKRKQEQEPIIDEAPKTNHSPTTPNSGKLKNLPFKNSNRCWIIFYCKTCYGF